jgi:aspartokinase/homoserine dehydrogenase 1
MQRIEVHKFGGTSVGSAERITGAARLVVEAASRARLAVVASAMSGVTDQLVAAVSAARAGDVDAALAAVERIRARHLETLAALAGDDEPVARADLLRISGELDGLFRAVTLMGELTPRVGDRVFSSGEKLSTRLLAVALRRIGRRAVALDADTFLETDGNFGEANPLSGVAERTIVAALLPRMDEGVIPIVTGFTGRAPDGATTTLGRGGSDLSATVIGAALRCDEVTIWTDVDGVFTADPRVVPEARVIEQLNYREAAELSFYGAKVLHQRTMIPVVGLGVPVVTRNSFNPGGPVTVVDGRLSAGSHPVKGVSAVKEHCLVSLEGKGMAGVPGVAARTFGAMAARGISVTMISQSSSEASICMAVPRRHAAEAEQVLKEAFRAELTRGEVEEVAVRDGVCLVAAVGVGMADHPGVAARALGALGQKRINVLAIAQGSSEVNITVAVDASQAQEAVRALHHAFGLHRIDTGEDAAESMDLIVNGCGKIGRALLDLVAARGHGAAHGFERLGLKQRVVGVGDRSGFAFRPTGLTADELGEVVAAKRAGRALASLPFGVAADSPAALVKHACRFRLVRPVLIDCTDADGMEAAFQAAFEGGCDVVTANKKPLAGPMAAHVALLEQAAARGRRLKAEATVGAGLPVVDTVEMLRSTGDRPTRIQGCFSGTLGLIVTRLEEGVAFSAAVREAIERGFTEPDPVADLSGEDVARKAIILGRVSGLTSDDVPVRLTGLVDAGWAGLPLPVLMERLRGLDDEMWRRVADARAEGKALRYVARVEPGQIVVGPEAVPQHSPIGRLEGTDNMVVIESERYRERPLVVSGPGAGVEVTAMGVLGDILRVAAERR